VSEMPTVKGECIEIATGLASKWNIPHFLGTMAGKGVQILAPKSVVVCSTMTKGN
jgi:hypothetical protein